jgi:hypothetical protein
MIMTESVKFLEHETNLLGICAEEEREIRKTQWSASREKPTDCRTQFIIFFMLPGAKSNILPEFPMKATLRAGHGVKLSR